MEQSKGEIMTSKLHKDRKDSGGDIVWIVVTCIVLSAIVFYVVSLQSVYFVSGGELNKTNEARAPSMCGNDPVIGIHSCCNHIQVYCQRFWWPKHCYIHNGSWKNEHHCKWGI